LTIYWEIYKMKLTKSKLKQIIKEELASMLTLETGIDVNTRKQAEADGWKDHKDGGDRASHWETFEGGKYLTYWQLGFDNRQEAEGY